MYKLIVTAIALVVLYSSSFYSASINNQDLKDNGQKFQSNNIKMKLYKSPYCNCCELYADELKKQGYDVEVIATEDMNPVKEKYNIPDDRQSCHTTVVDDYYIEGHVPMEAVKKLLEERPEIDGIGLPGMPIGTPGMPGEKTAPYEIYKSIDGKFLEYLTI